MLTIDCICVIMLKIKEGKIMKCKYCDYEIPEGACVCPQCEEKTERRIIKKVKEWEFTKILKYLITPYSLGIISSILMVVWGVISIIFWGWREDMLQPAVFSLLIGFITLSYFWMKKRNEDN